MKDDTGKRAECSGACQIQIEALWLGGIYLLILAGVATFTDHNRFATYLTGAIILLALGAAFKRKS